MGLREGGHQGKTLPRPALGGSDPHGLRVTPQEHLGGDVGPGGSSKRILYFLIPHRTQGRESYSPVTTEGQNEAGAGP